MNTRTMRSHSMTLRHQRFIFGRLVAVAEHNLLNARSYQIDLIFSHNIYVSLLFVIILDLIELSS